eukprot:scpid96992/ scgid33266/ 
MNFINGLSLPSSASPRCTLTALIFSLASRNFAAKSLTDAGRCSAAPDIRAVPCVDSTTALAAASAGAFFEGDVEDISSRWDQCREKETETKSKDRLFLSKPGRLALVFFSCNLFLHR